MLQTSMVIRITPAYAGNTNVIGLVTDVDMGSPPLTRGTQIKGESNVNKVRITPAYAGNT